MKILSAVAMLYFVIDLFKHIASSPRDLGAAGKDALILVVLLESAKTKLILGLNQDSSAITQAASLLSLNEQEEAYLASCRMVKGVGSTALLLADGERTPLQRRAD